MVSSSKFFCFLLSPHFSQQWYPQLNVPDNFVFAYDHKGHFWHGIFFQTWVKLKNEGFGWEGILIYISFENYFLSLIIKSNFRNDEAIINHSPLRFCFFFPTCITILSVNKFLPHPSFEQYLYFISRSTQLSKIRNACELKSASEQSRSNKNWRCFFENYWTEANLCSYYFFFNVKSVIHVSGTRIYQSFLEVSLFRPLPRAMTSPSGARAARRTLPGNRDGGPLGRQPMGGSPGRGRITCARWLVGPAGQTPGPQREPFPRTPARRALFFLLCRDWSPGTEPAGLHRARPSLQPSPVPAGAPGGLENTIRTGKKKQTHHLQSALREQQQAQAARALCPSIKSHRPLQRAGRGKTEHEMEQGNRAGKRCVETPPASLPQPKPRTVNTNSLRFSPRSFHAPQLAKLKKGF